MEFQFPCGMQVGFWTRITMKICKNPESVLLGLICGFVDIFLIPKASSAPWSSMSTLYQYSHANRYMSFRQLFFCEIIIFCFEKEVRSFY